MSNRYIFEITRTRAPTDPHAFASGEQSYIVRVEGGRFQSGNKSEVTLDWNGALLQDLVATRSPDCTDETQQRVGDELRRILGRGEWGRYEDAIKADLEKGPVYLLIRSDAAEIFLLPWELLTLEGSGQHLGEIAALHLGYEWSKSATAGATRDIGRVLFAWSAAGGKVPSTSHERALHNACGKQFDRHADVLAAVSLETLCAALDASIAQGRPVRVLHLLCHGEERDQGYGLVLSEGDGGDPEFVSPSKLRAALDPYKEHLRVVVLCACDGGNPGAPGTHLGSVAQALHRLGIPWVIASRYPLSKAGSVRFAKIFYEQLVSEGVSVEAAFAAGRRRLVLTARLRDWACLVLYTRQTDHGQHDGLHLGREIAPVSGVRLLVSRTIRVATLTRARMAALIASVMLIAGVGVGLWWPPLDVPRLPDAGRGVVVAGPWLASSDTRAAREDLCSELRAHGEQNVRCVSLAPIGRSDDDLVAAARSAGAALVVRVEAGPVARIMPVVDHRDDPDYRGHRDDPDASLLLDMPAVSIAHHDTRAVLARIVHAMAMAPQGRLRAQDRDTARALPILPSSEMPWRVTALAVLVRQLTDAPWQRNERAALIDIAETCRDEVGVSDAQCALVGVLVYGTDIAEGTRQAAERLHELSVKAPAVLADQASILLLQKECASQDAISVLVRLAEHASGCQRWQLMAPAACALDFATRQSGKDAGPEDARTDWQPGPEDLVTLRALAEPSSARDDPTCPDSIRADAFYARGAMWGGHSEPSLDTWRAAARSYAAAYTLSPERPEHRQALAEALLFAAALDPAQKDEYAAEAIAILDAPGANPDTDATEAFLLWVARGAPQDGVYRLCHLYHVAPPGPVVPHVDERLVCAEDDTEAGAGDAASACRMVRLLREDKATSSRSPAARTLCPPAAGLPGAQ